MTQLTAINTAKIISIVILIGYAIYLGISDVRQVLYLSLHVSYCSWWLLEQWIYPLRRQSIFSDPINIGGFINVLVIVGIFYTLPGYLAFTNPSPISYLTISIAIPVYIFGTLFNTSADIQKLTAKQYGIGLVTDGIWRFSRHINYLGDLLRYLSFSIICGNLWGYLVPGLIGLLYLRLIFQKEAKMIEKYPDYPTYQVTTKKLIPFIW